MINGITLTEIEQVLKFLKYKPKELGFEGSNGFNIKVYNIIDNDKDQKKLIFTFDPTTEANIIVNKLIGDDSKYRLRDILQANKQHKINRIYVSRQTRIDIIKRYDNGESLSKLSLEYDIDLQYLNNNYFMWKVAEEVNGDFYEAMIQASLISDNQSKGIVTRCFHVLDSHNILNKLDKKKGLSIYTNDELCSFRTFGPNTVNFLRIADDIYTGRRKV